MTAAIIVAIICLTLVLISGMFFNSMENIEKYKAELFSKEIKDHMEIAIEKFKDEENEEDE